MEFAVVGPHAAGAMNGAAMAFVAEARVTGNKVFQARAA
jgi:hypothetical protein